MIAQDSLRRSSRLSRRAGDNAPHAPDSEVVVLVVDKRGDTTIGVVLRSELRRLVLAFPKIEKDSLIGQAKFLQDDGDLPTRHIR